MIGIFQGSMTAKERVLRTFNHEKADRVPVNYLANPAIHKRVAAAWAYRRTKMLWMTRWAWTSRN